MGHRGSWVELRARGRPTLERLLQPGLLRLFRSHGLGLGSMNNTTRSSNTGNEDRDYSCRYDYCDYYYLLLLLLVLRRLLLLPLVTSPTTPTTTSMFVEATTRTTAQVLVFSALALAVSLDSRTTTNNSFSSSSSSSSRNRSSGSSSSSSSSGSALVVVVWKSSSGPFSTRFSRPSCSASRSCTCLTSQPIYRLQPPMSFEAVQCERRFWSSTVSILGVPPRLCQFLIVGFLLREAVCLHICSLAQGSGFWISWL